MNIILILSILCYDIVNCIKFKDNYENDCFNKILIYGNKQYIAYDMYNEYNFKLISPYNFITNNTINTQYNNLFDTGINIISDDKFCTPKCTVYGKKIKFDFKILDICFLNNSYIFWLDCSDKIIPIQIIKIINIKDEIYINHIITEFKQDIIFEINDDKNNIILPKITDIVKIKKHSIIQLYILFENIIIYSNNVL
ncbi:hypothetical protein MYSEV_054 [Mythimna separata entomopoxvirus 'L']|uniref:Uncharacterized protein n=1 Tax=Mythimna separata entomopoxvirus 'L' TaxID=1293572 RepID=A0A916KQ18_9POXV|nr:hypothetical protein MYSEV_054 [Mythimna separata entomopoxvirus 'L']CCU56252.1 hypothetical protein MYSEV_054 [Mythimna separata entomopoxvirus 'L']